MALVSDSDTTSDDCDAPDCDPEFEQMRKDCDNDPNRYGEALYLAYSRHKKYWRRLTGKPLKECVE